MKRIVTLTGLLSPFVLAMIVQACAASSETSRPDVESPPVVPTVDSGADAPTDAGTDGADRPLLPCAAGNLCTVKVPLSFGYVTAIRGRSKNDVWATGSRGALMHYEGQAWASVASDSSETASSLFLTPDELWMIAGNFVTRRGAEPGTVRRMQLGTPHTLSGVAVLPNGDAYLALLRTTTYFPLAPPLVKIVDFDTQEVEATAWPIIPGVDPEAAAASPEEMIPRASFLVPDRALWLVGDHAKVVRYPVTPLGTGEFVSVGSQANLRAAWGHDEHLWAVGADGTILHYDGATWHAQDSGTSVELEAVFGFSDRDIWVAGREGTVLHFDGERWSKLDVGDYQGRLETIWGSASDDVWIGGELAMFHWGALP